MIDDEEDEGREESAPSQEEIGEKVNEGERAGENLSCEEKGKEILLPEDICDKMNEGEKTVEDSLAKLEREIFGDESDSSSECEGPLVRAER